MKRILILLSIVLVLFSCTENNVTNIVGYDRTLVIITDFSLESDIMIGIEGAVRQQHPDVDIKLIKNQAFDVFESGVLLESAAQSFPENTYFAVIVDPGTAALKFVYEAAGRRVLVPDNGASTKMRKLFSATSMHYIDDPSLFGDEFNDIPSIPYDKFWRDAILNLLSDKPLSVFGSVCETPQEINIINPKVENNSVIGQVQLTDNFGNCETNISLDFMTGFTNGDILEISTTERRFFAKYGTHYASVEAAENVAFPNSKDRLEIAVNLMNMSERYNIKAGDQISVKKATIIAGILRYNSSELVDNIIAGIKLRMNERGFKEGINISYIEKNANGDIANFPDLIQEMNTAGTDLLIPVSTPASQAAVQFVPQDIPIVYTYVTSPEFAGIVNKRLNVTGLSDATNFDDYLGFVNELLPEIKNAGRIYNPNEPNSAYSQGRFLELGPFYGITYHNQEVFEQSEIESAFNSIINTEADAILIAADNTMNLGFKGLAELSSSSKIPLIGDSYENASDGALASISVDYDLLASSTGNTVSNVILGVKADDIPIQRFPTSVITLNQKTADKIEFTFPQSILNKAKHIIE